MASEDIQAFAALDAVSQSAFAKLSPMGYVANKRIFAHNENSSVEAAILQIRQGALIMPSTSTNLSSTLTFMINNQNILANFYIKAQLTIPRYGQLSSNWFLREAVDTITISMPGQGTISYNGRSAYDMLIRSSSDAQRLAYNALCPAVSANSETAAAAYVYEFVCPIMLPWSSSPDPTGAFPLDASAASNQIVLSLTLKPVYQWMYGTSTQNPTLPTSFDYCELKCINVMSHISPELSSRFLDNYRLPFFWLQSYKQSGVSMTAGQELSLQLGNLPVGELVSIIVSCVDQATIGTSGNTVAATGANIPFTYMRLNWSGLDLIIQDEKELALTKLYNGVVMGDGFNYTITVPPHVVGASASVSQTLNACEVFGIDTTAALTDGEYFLAQSYGGQSFNLYVKTATTGTVDFYVTYVINAALEFKNGSAKIYF